MQAKDLTAPYNQDEIIEKVNRLRVKYHFTEYVGDTVEFHPSGRITFPILGTKAKQEDKLAFDPDRTKRRRFWGGSSFDMAPKPYNKYYAL
ncbi:MAG: phosphomannomutase, partial [Clostridia bacterium]|nr:phosphomannomutase [Clostridia bacterium]